MDKIAYIFSDELIKQCNKIPVLRGRASMVHELIRAYKLIDSLAVVTAMPATEDELRLFHSAYYLDYLKSSCNDESGIQCVDDDDDVRSVDSDGSTVDDEHLNYGLGYDCPKFANLWKFVRHIGGGSITAAKELLNGRRIAINWCGGWHHGQRDEAEGFCYVNDIAMAIQMLRMKFQRILYIDFDVHHGNGVENAFAHAQRVLTVSFHQREPGFFPGSGDVHEIGIGNGRGFSVNFPYKANLRGALFVKYFVRTIRRVVASFEPNACVVQCGADCIAGDPLGGANLILENIGDCVKEILMWRLPTMFLGGGGYNFVNTARLWTYLTAVICNLDDKIDNDIPDNKYFLKYGPGYELKISPRHLDDTNTEHDLERVYSLIKANFVRNGLSTAATNYDGVNLSECRRPSHSDSKTTTSQAN